MYKFIFSFLFFITLTSVCFGQWLHQNSGTTERFMTSCFLDQNLGWAAGNNGTVVKTTDGGDTWIAQSINTSDNIHSICFINSLLGWAAFYEFTPSRHGSVMHTTDGGETWTSQFSISGATLHSIYFSDQKNGWTVGSSGVMFKTTNGGQNWSDISPVSGFWLYSVFFINDQVGWISGGLPSQILKTTNGGSNWIAQSIPVSERIMSVFFLDLQNGWAVGAGGRIVKTTNGGNNWDFIPSPVVQELRNVRFSDNMNGWAVGLGGVILHSLDGGVSWSIQSSNTSENLFGVSFVNNVQGWVAGENGTILATNNGGIPVELVSFTASQSNDQIQLSWITATELNNQGFEIERKTTESWEKIGFVNGNGTTTEMQYYSFTDNSGLVNNVYKIYYRLKQIDFDGTYEYSNEVTIELSQPDSYLLNQNYPNPFNPSTIISWQLPESKFVTLKIYDVLGNEVASLINEEKPAGNFEVEFNATALSSGIYYYKLVAGDFVDVKKMILLK